VVGFHSDFGMDYFWYKFRSFVPDYNFHPSFINVSNDISQGYGFFQSYQVENYLNYKDTIRDVHNVDFVLGTSYRNSRGESAGGSSQFIPSEVQFNENFQILDAGQDTN